MTHEGRMTDEKTLYSSARGRAHGMVALARARLRTTWGGRFARILGGVGALGFGVAASLAGEDGRSAAHSSSVLIFAARVLPWGACLPLAFAASRDLHTRDRNDGILALAFARGASWREIEAARVLGAMIECAAVALLPLLVIGAASAAFEPSLSAAVACARIGLLVAGFALVFGATVGGVAATCGRIARRRGPLLFSVVLLGPWAASEVAGTSLSIPSALNALLDFVVGMGAK